LFVSVLNNMSRRIEDLKEKFMLSPELNQKQVSDFERKFIKGGEVLAFTQDSIRKKVHKAVAEFFDADLIFPKKK